MEVSEALTLLFHDGSQDLLQVGVGHMAKT